MTDIAINLYTIRELDRSTRERLELVADAGYDGVEFAGAIERDGTQAIVETLADTGLDAAGAHVGIESLEADVDAVAETYSPVVDAVVVPYLDQGHFESRDAAVAAARRLDGLRDDLAVHGLGLDYHNHDHEFVSLDGTTGFETFADAAAVGLELDVGWVQTSGHDPVSFIERYGERIDRLHVKDMAGGEFRELGDGDVDVAACVEAARAANVSWLVYEHDDPENPLASIEHGAAFIRAL